jgi:hypothetical protein
MFAADVAVLERVTRDSSSDWLDGPGRGAFVNRRRADEGQAS